MKHLTKIILAAAFAIIAMSMAGPGGPTNALNGFILKGGNLLGMSPATVTTSATYAPSCKAVQNYTYSKSQANNRFVVDSSYQEYVANITQTSTSAPTAVILNALESNFLDTLTLARASAGSYTFTKTGAFPTASKVHIFIEQPVTSASATTMNVLQGVRTSANALTFTTYVVNYGTPGRAATDALLTNNRVRIVVEN